MIPALFAFTQILAQHHAVVTVGDRTEVRARTLGGTAQQQGTPRGPIIDVSTLPIATLAISDRRFAHLSVYSPMITVRGDTPSGTSPELLHAGRTRSTWTGRLVRLVLDSSFTYGTRNYTDVIAPASPIVEPGPPRPLQLAPSTRAIRIGSSSTSLRVAWVPSRRWTADVSLGYSVIAGTDATSLLFIPSQRSTSFETTLGYAASRVDRIFTTFIPSVVTISRAPCATVAGFEPNSSATCDRTMQILDVGEGYRHTWSRTTSVSLLAGISARRTRLAEGLPFQTVLAPLVVADLTHRDERSVFSLDGRIGTVVDQRTGIADTRVSAGFGFTRVHGGIALRSNAQYTHSILQTTPIALRGVRGEAALAFRLSRDLDADGGVRLNWQSSGGLTAVTTNVFIGLAYHPQRMVL